MKKILIPLTNHATLGDTDQANGTFSPELTHVLHVITEAGFDYDLASVQGGKAPIYGTDIEGDDINTAMLADGVLQQGIDNTLPVRIDRQHSYTCNDNTH